MQDIKVTMVQCHQAWEAKETNLTNFSKLLENNKLDTNIIVFPEMFHTGFSMQPEKLAETMEGEGIAWLKSTAHKYDAAVVASLIIKEKGAFYNRLVFVRPSGEIQFYDKRKLFGLAKEEEHYTAGKTSTIVNYLGWNIRLQVCYDLRFPEIQRNKVVKGVYDYDLMINVANWPAKRSLHWKTLLRARAIENQCYLVGVNRVGEGNGLPYSGDSMVLTPLGETLAEITQVEKVQTETISLKYLAEARVKMPFLKDR